MRHLLSDLVFAGERFRTRLSFFLSLSAILIGIHHTRAQCIVTAAGAVNIEGGAATATSLNFPQAMLPEPTGTSLLVADTENDVVRKVLFSNRTVTTVAGQFRRSGYAGNGGQATSAILNAVVSLVSDNLGGYYMCENDNHVVRRVFANGTVVLVAGTGVAGWSGDGGPASLARLSAPSAMSSSGAGGLYIAEYDTRVVRQVWCAGGIPRHTRAQQPLPPGPRRCLRMALSGRLLVSHTPLASPETGAPRRQPF